MLPLALEPFDALELPLVELEPVPLALLEPVPALPDVPLVELLAPPVPVLLEAPLVDVPLVVPVLVEALVPFDALEVPLFELEALPGEELAGAELPLGPTEVVLLPLNPLLPRPMLSGKNSVRNSSATKT